MSDLIYILLTLMCFTGLALLVGLIDRRLGSAEAAADDVPAADETAGVNVPHDNFIPGAAR
ncbi:hypothetical protein [Nocardioides albus]|uniref:Uncharacterized protein n=1 Tax=Nocardioides albus TaxID=1841 RepID=A0A7W5A0L7_9ACTN|nr:hypothetical protein [Nocardioides albus]MBB3087260.1 hypothetical protein [Nocardioides albus]